MGNSPSGALNGGSSNFWGKHSISPSKLTADENINLAAISNSLTKYSDNEVPMPVKK
jgi:hypothetical protein